MDVLAKKDKKYPIKFDGKEYELSPVNWNVLAGIEEEMGCSIQELMPRLQKLVYSTVLTLAWIFLRDKYDLTKEQVGRVTNHQEILTAASIISDALLDFFGVE
jgi:hypothetical protein